MRIVVQLAQNDDARTPSQSQYSGYLRLIKTQDGARKMNETTRRDAASTGGNSARLSIVESLLHGTK